MHNDATNLFENLRYNVRSVHYILLNMETAHQNAMKNKFYDFLALVTNEPRREKTGLLHMRKQRRRSASQ